MKNKLITVMGAVLLMGAVAQAKAYECATNSDGLYVRTAEYKRVGHRVVKTIAYNESSKEFINEEMCLDESADELVFLKGLYSAKGCAEMGGILLPSNRCAMLK